jgi:hypothetical protein
LSISPAASAGPAGSAASSPELELLLDELELLLELFASEPPFASGVPLTAASFPSSPGNGKSPSNPFFPAGAAPEVAPGVVPETAPGASAVCGTPLGFAGVAYGASEVPLPLAASGNGNCSVALDFPETAGVVPHGTGCGATEHGTRPAAGVGAGTATGVGAGTAFGEL